MNCGAAVNVQAAPFKIEFSKNPILVGCFVVGGLMFIGIVLAIIFMGNKSMEESLRRSNEKSEEYRKKRTAETIGKITGHETRRSGVKGTSDYILYDFVVDGKTYSDDSLIPNGSQMKSPKGKEGNICYDPADPKNNTISFKGENRYCGY